MGGLTEKHNFKEIKELFTKSNNDCGRNANL